MEGQQLDDALKLIDDAFPGTASRLRRKIQEGSENERLARELLQERQLGGDISKAYTAPKAVALGGARLIGKGIRDTGELKKSIIKGVTEPIKEIHSASPEQLQKLSEFALSKGTAAGRHAADVLNNVVNAPSAKRKAMLFTLMQQPGFREVANEFLDSSAKMLGITGEE